MSHRLCPLKEAALDAPHLPAFCALTYRELDQKIDELASRLSMCVKPEEKVAVRLSSSLDFILLLFACLRIGAPFCPLNLRLPAAQIEAQLEELRPKLFIDNQGWHLRTEPLPSPSACILFTSGSTATPKCAHFSLDNLVESARGVIDAVDLRLQDGWLLSLPLYHVAGLSIVFRCVLARAQIVLDASYSGVTHLSYVPTQLYRAWPTYRSLRTLMVGGAPISNIPASLPIVCSYGMTEMSSTILASRAPVWKEGALYLGFPLPGRELKVEQGELYARGACLFQGYDGKGYTDWFATKDLARFDPQLGFAIVGRKDNQFISGGENIQPEEIERELLTHPSILEAVIVPKLDEEFGARPVAYIKTINSPLTLQEVRAYLEKRIPKYKLPIALYPLEETEFKVDRKKFFTQLNKSPFFSP